MSFQKTEDREEKESLHGFIRRVSKPRIECYVVYLELCRQRPRAVRGTYQQINREESLDERPYRTYNTTSDLFWGKQ